MSKTDFQERLRRLNSNPDRRNSDANRGSHSANGDSGKLRFGHVGLGGGIMGLGVYLLRYLNRHYDAVAESAGGGMIAALGLGGLAATLIGVIIMIRGVRNRYGASASSKSNDVPARLPQSKKTESRTAMVITSITGLALGIATLHLLAISAAAHRVETELALNLSAGSIFVVLVILIFCLLVGLVGLFARGYSLWRVPLYFVLGVVLTFATVRLLHINMLDWPELLESLQEDIGEAKKRRQPTTGPLPTLN